ncbi:hypothetical protein KNE206_73120 [Kitasatospora sp. NE20-6]|uniref:hypothetical protein n=1 Tax=Kitasatospora sp. NE20-6 TaxID=2859066 RepID=UPI0034DC5192
MNRSPSPSSVPVPVPVPDARAVLDACHERVLEREGIPMFLAFQFDGAGPVADRRARAEGAALAPLIAHYREELAPGSADDDQAALIDVLQVMAIAHFEPQDTP